MTNKENEDTNVSESSVPIDFSHDIQGFKEESVKYEPVKVRWLSLTLFIGATISLIMGLFKMFAYENSELPFVDNVNAYVGGDAYNYIINGTHATAYFVLFGALLVAGFLAEILHNLKGSAEKMSVSEIEEVKSERADDGKFKLW